MPAFVGMDLNAAAAEASAIDPPGQTALPLLLSCVGLLLQLAVTVSYCWELVADLMR